MAETAARLFLCARCRRQVALCSRCDRGQIYCGAACSAAARRANQREAGRRYQRGPDGRLKHAARQRRWRQHAKSAPEAVRAERVTHQGSPEPGGDAPLPACPHEPVDPRPSAVDAEAPAVGAAAHGQRLCARCASALPRWLRQGFLRRRRAAAGAHLAAWPPRPRGRDPRSMEHR